MKKRGLVCILTAVTVFSGCSAPSVKELLSPPRLNEEQSQIYDALKSAAKNDITLKYPKSGQYRSAFVIKDIDDEPSDEAIVFYETPNITEGSALRINFLDKSDGKWVSVYDIAVDGTEVEKVIFSDLGNGKTSVLVTLLMQNTSDKTTDIIAYNGQPEQVFSCRHAYMDIFDVNGDGKDEMFTIETDKTAEFSETAVFGFSEGIFTELGRTELSGNFAEYRNVVHGKYDNSENTAIFIDYGLSDGRSGTDAVICKQNRLSLTDDNDVISRRSNSYTPNIYSSDADGDGCIEIPSNRAFPGYEELSRSEQINMTVWYSLENSGRLREKFRSFVGTKGDYMLILPKEMNDKITCSVSIAENSVSFSSYKNSVAGDMMFKLYGSPDSNKYAESGYIFVGESASSGWYYYAEIPDKGTLTEKDVKNMFIGF